MSAVIVSLALLVATGAWTTAMGVGLPGRSATAVVAMSASLWTATVTAVVGMVVSKSRWARRLAMVVAAAHACLAVVRPADGWWWLGVVLTAVATVAVTGPWLSATVRSRPAAAGPPARAVLLPLVLIWIPFLLGAAAAEDLPGAVLAGSALLAAYWFIRTLPGGLAVVRLGWPALALALAWPMGTWQAVAVAVAGAGVVAAVAWHPSVARAVHPLVERGSVVPIPPELVPRAVLDAAAIDERGRPRR